MKTQIPEQLKADVPHTTWGRLLIVTPVVMTVIATLLAGLASSEMTRAQYDRALGAQLQSKAGDQWNYFQAKKLRGAMQNNTLELLRATAEVQSLDATSFPAGSNVFASLQALNTGTLQPPPAEGEVKTALEAVAANRPESEIVETLKNLDNKTLAAALETAKANARAFDTDIQRVVTQLDQAEKTVPPTDTARKRDHAALRMQFNAARYDNEARLNQTVANLYELQVRKANISAERHHQRSGKFFVGMLAAQAAVIVSTFSLAAQKRNFLWSVAAIAGLLAIIFAVYVYLYI